MRKYRIEQNITRQDSFDGAKPRDTEWAPNLTAAGDEHIFNAFLKIGDDGHIAVAGSREHQTELADIGSR